ncbi:sterol desaturase family protein [Pseudooceanicola sp. MF1-13]|uniref:sterol desaturase family protein n=1 Tax=Pseudooceanicola sp. MF1-13 TaxID=3379095 RepID=UPI0038924E8D
MWDQLFNIYAGFFGSDVLVAPEYLLFSLATAWVIYLLGKDRPGFWRWLAPREIWTHKSHRVDLQLFVLGRLMTLTGMIGRVTLTTVIALWVGRLIASETPPAMVLPGVAVTLLLFLSYDFAAYWVHRAFHRIGLIWPLHAVHHSAEVMTPFTYYRQHPGALIVSALAVSVFAGGIQGLVLGTLTLESTVIGVAGINAFALVANLAMANFHHSHIRVTYWPWLERLLISPAQHQVHHSRNPAHFDRNFGQTLAVWDLMFGTLYIAAHENPDDSILIGLDGVEERALSTHRLGIMLWDPLVRVWRQLVPGKS